MLLTKECDYGLRIVRALGDSEKKTAEDICAAELIPGQYVYKILKKLDRAGIVKSIRGRDGGYKLSKPLDSISIFDVVFAIDGNLYLAECLKDGAFCPRNETDQPCSVHMELSRIHDVLVNQMQQKNMLEIVTAAE